MDRKPLKRDSDKAKRGMHEAVDKVIDHKKRNLSARRRQRKKSLPT